MERRILAAGLAAVTAAGLAAGMAGDGYGGPYQVPGDDTMQTANEHSLESARAAARAFCEHFNFPAHQVQELAKPPLFGPVPIDRNGQVVMAYRWLGGGRGGPYVQVELVEGTTHDVIVYGGDAHGELGPWKYVPPTGN